MGQRTQVYIAERLVDDLKDEECKIMIYHNQWGYGKQLVLDATGLYCLIRECRIDETLNVSGVHIGYEDIITRYLNDDKDKVKTLCRPLPESLSYWKNMINYVDNNDGICVIYREVDRYGRTKKAQIAFLCGDIYEKPNETGSIVSAEQYMTQYHDKEEIKPILDYFNAACKMFKIEQIKKN